MKVHVVEVYSTCKTNKSLLKILWNKNLAKQNLLHVMYITPVLACKVSKIKTIIIIIYLLSFLVTV